MSKNYRMVPFDGTKAHVGMKVITRGGEDGEILSIEDGRGYDITTSFGENGELYETYNLRGECVENQRNEQDLVYMEAPRPKINPLAVVMFASVLLTLLAGVTLILGWKVPASALVSFSVLIQLVALVVLAIKAGRGE